MKKLQEVFDLIDANKKEAEWLHTGIKLLDDFLDGGFLRKELIVLGGQTGGGKSYFGSNFLWNIARQGFESAYFSLEISSEMVVSRMVGALSNIKPVRLLYANLLEEEYNRKIEAKAQLKVIEGFTTFYDDVYELVKIKQEIRDKKYEFVVVDFIQNIIEKTPDEYARLSLVALELQKMAKECNCCILVLSQVSNKMNREKRDSTFVEYKGSGSIATVCDIGMFIVRGSEVDANGLYLHVRKNRRGISGQMIPCTFVEPGGFIK